MERIYVRLTRLLAGLSVVFVSGMYADVQKNAQLQKVFHHQAAMPHKVATAKVIELGSIVFYFSHTPIINTLSSGVIKKGGSQELVLFFPKATGTSDEIKQIQSINNLESVPYSVKLETVKKPTDGLRFSIAYDPKKVGVKYDFFDFIGGHRPQPGVRFQFYNQELLHELSAKTDRSMLNVACAKRVSQVVIDCGHGGDDSGAVSFAQLKEKDVALAVGMRVADGLKKKGFNVAMTRDNDFFVPLDERTTLANNLEHPALFLSIHANASVNKGDTGIETYYLDPLLFTGGSGSLNALDTKLVMQQEKARSNQSKLLAQLTHNNLLKEVGKSNSLIIDRSIHQTVLQVLMGTTMPAALIEVGFLSNSVEAGLLSDKNYQQCIAQGICNGVVSYFNATKSL
ncbi:MAG: N-acetylmuramoyl-L-alanine amidase [Candidatus Babeliales bacterium]|nr:N-acetylmuramoyl-L-alanine amidase [Candidatus Babeliales bacterium]